MAKINQIKVTLGLEYAAIDQVKKLHDDVVIAITDLVQEYGIKGATISSNTDLADLPIIVEDNQPTLLDGDGEE